MIRLWRIFWRSASLEWRAIKCNPLDQIMIVWLPAFAVFFIWSTFSNAQVHDLPIGVLNYDKTSLSRQLERMVDASPNTQIINHYSNEKEMEAALRTVDVYAVLVIPKDFSNRIKRVESSPIILNVNAQYGTHSGIIQTGVSGAVRTFSAGVEWSIRQKMGTPKLQANDAVMPIRPFGKMAFNLSVNYQYFLGSEIIPALLHILATVVGVGVIGRELRKKSIGKWFNGVCGSEKSHVLPLLAMPAALFGKLLWQMLAFSFWLVVAMYLMVEHNLVSVESFAITFLNAWMMILISLWLGVILTLLTMSKRMGLSLSAIITAPAFAYSGIAYPIFSMPEGAQTISSLLPLTHYLKLQVAQLQAHADWRLALPTTYAYLLTIIVMVFLAVLLTCTAIRQKHKWGKR